MKRQIWAFVLLVLCGGVLYLMRTDPPAAAISLGIAPLDLTTVQIVALPWFLLFASQLQLFGVRVPSLVLLLSSAAAFAGLGVAYSYYGDPESTFVLARLSDDPFEGESRIFREEINRSTRGASETRAVRYYAPLSSDLEARVTQSRDNNRRAIVWGNERFLTVSFPLTPDLAPSGALLHELPPQVRQLRLMTSVPTIGFSFEPRGESSRFLGALFSGLLSQGLEAWSSQEGWLWEAAQMVGRWTSYAHRGYPLWVLGNRYLNDTLDSAPYESAPLGCAIRAYRLADDQLKSGDNPELRAAIRNNLGVALLLQGFLEEDGKEFREGYRFLRLATHTRREKNTFRVTLRGWSVAAQNSAVVRAWHRPEIFATHTRSGKKARRPAKKHRHTT